MIRFLLFTLGVLGCSGSVDAPVAPDSATVDAVVDGEVVDSAPSADAPATGNVPGKYVHKEKAFGMDREFIVYVPEKARGPKPVPVVFMLHGTSGDGEKFFNLSHWREKADAEGLIAVFPSSLTYCLYEDENRDGDWDDPGERKVTTKWASGALGDPMRLPLCSADDLAKLMPAQRALADHPLADDVAFFRFMLDFLGKRYTVDSKRIYASGFSNGASMTSRLAVEMSDRFAAIAAHAATMGVTPRAATRPISIVFSVGSVDDRFTTSSFPIAESTAKLPFFAEAIGEYLTTTQLADKYAYDEVGTGRAARWTYTTSTIGASNRFMTVLIANCGHEYPNGTNHPMVMADALWEVFKTQSLP